MNEDENVPPVTPDEPAEPVTPAPTEPAESTPEQPVDVEQLQATNKKLFERAKKAEAEVKALKGTTPANPSSGSPQTSVEETVLLANGMPEELVNKLKSVAKVEGYASLLKAQNDPIFVAVKEKFEKDKKSKEASLPASRGAGSPAARKNLTSPGLSREEHMAMVKALP